MDMDTALEVSAEGLVFTLLDLFMSPDLPKDLVREVLMLSLVITHRTTGPQLSPPMDTPHAMVAVASVALSLDILVLATGMDMVLEASAEGLVFTLLDLFMSPDLPKDLASAVLILSLVIIHRTTGPQLSPPMDTPHVMDAVASAVLSQDILVLAMGMAMVSEVSAGVLVCTQLGQSMSPDQHRVSVADTCTSLLLLLCIVQYVENKCLLNLT